MGAQVRLQRSLTRRKRPELPKISPMSAVVDRLAAPAFAALPPGATVAIVAPAGPAAPELVAALPGLLQRHGFKAKVYPSCHRRSGLFAGNDDERLADLLAALQEPEVAAIWCLRGGYGSTRLLPDLDVLQVARAARPLIGFSDITALFALWLQAGVPVLHAPMPATDLLLPGREDDAQALFDVLSGGLADGVLLQPQLAADAWHLPGDGAPVTGRLIGGNLALLASLCGTPWQPHGQRAILFLKTSTSRPIASTACCGSLSNRACSTSWPACWWVASPVVATIRPRCCANT